MTLEEAREHMTRGYYDGVAKRLDDDMVIRLRSKTPEELELYLAGLHAALTCK